MKMCNANCITSTWISNEDESVSRLVWSWTKTMFGTSKIKLRWELCRFRKLTCAWSEGEPRTCISRIGKSFYFLTTNEDHHSDFFFMSEGFPLFPHRLHWYDMKNAPQINSYATCNLPPMDSAKNFTWRSCLSLKLKGPPWKKKIIHYKN